MESSSAARLILALSKGLNRWTLLPYQAAFLQAAPALAAWLQQQGPCSPVGVPHQQLQHIRCISSTALHHSAQQALPSWVSEAAVGGAHRKLTNTGTSSRRSRGDPQVLDRMERFTAEFYKLIAVHVDADPQAAEKHAGAVKGLVSLMTQGLTLFGPKSDPSASSQSGPVQWAHLIATSEPPASQFLPPDYQARLLVYRDALRAIVRLYQLPVEPWNDSRSRDARERKLQDPIAQQLVQDVSVLIRAFEATPGLTRQASHYNVLLCALALAGQTELAEQLFSRMSAGHKGPQAQPDLESANQLFGAFSRAGDVPGMWRTVQGCSREQSLVRQHRTILPRFINSITSTTLRNAVAQQDWETAGQVLEWTEKRQQPAQQEAQQEAYPVHVAPSVLMITMVQAAGNNKFSLVAAAWKQLQARHTQDSRHPVLLGPSACRAVLQACVQSDDVELASRLATEVFERHCQSLKQAQDSPALLETSLLSATGPWPPYPSHEVYQLYIHMQGRAQLWEAAWQSVAQLETHHAARHPRSLSALGGLAPLAELMAKTPGATFAAYDVLLRRTALGHVVSVAMMNVVLRAIAMSGDVDKCGQLFEEYSAAGFPQDTGAYNAVMESCVVAAQPLKAKGVLEHMKSSGVQADEDTYDLLMRAYVAAKDMEGAHALLLYVRTLPGISARMNTMQQAVETCKEVDAIFLLPEFETELDFLECQQQAARPLDRHAWRRSQSAAGRDVVQRSDVTIVAGEGKS